MSIEERRKMVDIRDKKLSVKKQCKLLGIHRSGLYYQPKGESAFNLKLMELMDKKYLQHPYYGANRMHTWLRKDKGYHVSVNRVERLYYKVMGLRAILPGPHTSKRRKDHKVYPYLLRGLQITRPNQVWGMDITYIPMERGFLYLAAIIDLYSRYVVSWSISNAQDSQWVAKEYLMAVKRCGTPEIINTDQGVQFTSDAFASSVQSSEAKLSMDGKGRAIDNVFIERLWRTVKYENIYLYSYEDGKELYEGLKKYFKYYNEQRRHTSLEKEPPIHWYERAA